MMPGDTDLPAEEAGARDGARDLRVGLARSSSVVRRLGARRRRAASKVDGGGSTVGLVLAGPTRRQEPDEPERRDPTAPVDEKLAVFLSVDPTDAQIGLADGKMQPPPVTITIGTNEEAKIRIEKKGYVSQTVTLKGSDVDPKAAWRVYSLKPLAGTAAPKTPAGAKPRVDKPPAPTSALPPPTAKPTPPANAPCDPPRFRDPFDGKCH